MSPNFTLDHPRWQPSRHRPGVPIPLSTVSTDVLKCIDQLGIIDGRLAYVVETAGELEDTFVAARGGRIKPGVWIDLGNARQRVSSALGALTKFHEYFHFLPCPFLAPPISEEEEEEGDDSTCSTEEEEADNGMSPYDRVMLWEMGEWCTLVETKWLGASKLLTSMVQDCLVRQKLPAQGSEAMKWWEGFNAALEGFKVPLVPFRPVSE